MVHENITHQKNSTEMQGEIKCAERSYMTMTSSSGWYNASLLHQYKSWLPLLILKEKRYNKLKTTKKYNTVVTMVKSYINNLILMQHETHVLKTGGELRLGDHGIQDVQKRHHWFVLWLSFHYRICYYKKHLKHLCCKSNYHMITVALNAFSVSFIVLRFPPAIKLTATI
jgi:hypothetical protein